MKNLFKNITLFLALSLFFVVPIHSEENIFAEPKAQEGEKDNVTITTDQKKYIIDIDGDDSKTISYSVNNLDKEHTVRFYSSDPSIASVDNNGKITAKSVGKTQVTILVKVTNEEKSYSQVVDVEVIQSEGSITFSENEYYLIRGNHYDIDYVTVPEGLSSSKIIWSSSNPEIATVVNGRVTGLKVGETTITAQYNNAVAKMKIIVTVPLKKIEFNPTQLEIGIDDEVSLPSLIYVPYDTTSSKSATYTIEDDTVIELVDGKIRGLKEGQTTITAQIRDVSAKLIVTVKRNNTTSDAFPLTMEVVKEDEEGLLLKPKFLETYDGQKYDILLPLETIKTYMENRETTRLYLELDDVLLEDNMAMLNEMMLDKDLLLPLGAQKLEVHFLNSKNETLLVYRFGERWKEPINLKLTVHKVDELSPLSRVVSNQPAFEIKFANESGFPDNTTLMINTKVLDKPSANFYFLYQQDGTKLVYTNQQVQAQDNLVKFNVKSNSYVVTFNLIGHRQETGVIIALCITLGGLLLAIGGYKYKQVRDKE